MGGPDEQCRGHLGVGEDTGPLGEGEVGGDHLCWFSRPPVSAKRSKRSGQGAVRTQPTRALADQCAPSAASGDEPAKSGVELITYKS
jgi:hypothetical protein